MRAALPGVRGQRRHRALGHLAPHRYRRADRVAAHRLGLLAPAQPAGLPPHPCRRRLGSRVPAPACSRTGRRDGAHQPAGDHQPPRQPVGDGRRRGRHRRRRRGVERSPCLQRHEYARRHVLPRPEEVRPIVYNSWEATGFDVNEDNQKRLAGMAAALGVEMFVVDDGWFGARSSDHAGLGDWTVNPRRFPNGLGPLIAEVHRLGMRFGIWVEPEMVNPDSDLYREHPDWVLHMANRRRTTLRNQLVLNFARPDVAEWALFFLDTAPT